MAIPQTIKKRTGDIVPFDDRKIFNAMQKAFVAENVPIEDLVLEQMTNRVIAQISEKNETGDAPTVEWVQDNVEQVIMERGYFKVAKHYILYRFEHAKVRTQKVIEKIEVLRRAKAHRSRIYFLRDVIKRTRLVTDERTGKTSSADESKSTPSESQPEASADVSAEATAVAAEKPISSEAGQS